MTSASQPTIDQRHLVLCFQVHQPKRLHRQQGVSETPASPSSIFDDTLDREIMQRVAHACYLPANRLLLKLIRQYPQIKVAFAISGTALEQLEAYAPEALESFRELAATGSVDFMLEPYYHSLSFLMDGEEFEAQILEHAEKMVEHFGIRPAVFRNTCLLYNDEVGRRIAMLGFQGVLIEGNRQTLEDKSPHDLYEHSGHNGLRILTRNPSLSDDIAFRVAEPYWNITAQKYLSWLEAMPEHHNLVTVAIDYETFGEHHKPETGIFNFLENLLLLIAIQNSYSMVTPAEVVQKFAPKDTLHIPDYVAVSGAELADWVGNEKQREAFAAMMALELRVKKINDPEITKAWRQLQASDHFYYMSDKDIQLSPYASSQEAFDNYMKALQTLSDGIQDSVEPEKSNEALEAERRTIDAPVWALNIEPHSGYTP